MLRYQVPGYRPAGIPIRQQLGQTQAASIAVGVSSLLATALGAGTVWIGIRAGERERKGYKALGYTVAVFGAVVVLSSLTGAAGFFTGLFVGKSSAA
jgi:hypothetical protein